MKTEFLAQNNVFYRGILFTGKKEQAEEVTNFFKTYILSPNSRVLHWSYCDDTETMTIEFCGSEHISTKHIPIRKGEWLIVILGHYRTNDYYILSDRLLESGKVRKIDIGCSGMAIDRELGAEGRFYIRWDGDVRHQEQFTETLAKTQSNCAYMYSTFAYGGSATNNQAYLKVYNFRKKDSQEQRHKRFRQAPNYLVDPGVIMVAVGKEKGRIVFLTCSPEFFLLNYMFTLETVYPESDQTPEPDWTPGATLGKSPKVDIAEGKKMVEDTSRQKLQAEFNLKLAIPILGVRKGFPVETKSGLPAKILAVDYENEELLVDVQCEGNDRLGGRWSFSGKSLAHPSSESLKLVMSPVEMELWKVLLVDKKGKVSYTPDRCLYQEYAEEIRRVWEEQKKEEYSLIAVVKVQELVHLDAYMRYTQQWFWTISEDERLGELSCPSK